MANWCSNEITITGNNEIIEKLLNEISSEERPGLDFNMIICCPENFPEYESIKDAFDIIGFDRVLWCVENWGTKGNACEVNIRTGDNNVVISFETAWSPSLPITEKLAQKYPMLSFSHHFKEEGVGFRGFSQWKNGKLVHKMIGKSG